MEKDTSLKSKSNAVAANNAIFLATLYKSSLLSANLSNFRFFI